MLGGNKVVLFVVVIVGLVARHWKNILHGSVM